MNILIFTIFFVGLTFASLCITKKIYTTSNKGFIQSVFLGYLPFPLIFSLMYIMVNEYNNVTYENLEYGINLPVESFSDKTQAGIPNRAFNSADSTLIGKYITPTQEDAKGHIPVELAVHYIYRDNLGSYAYTKLISGSQPLLDFFATLTDQDINYLKEKQLTLDDEMVSFYRGVKFKSTILFIFTLIGSFALYCFIFKMILLRDKEKNINNNNN